MTTTSKNKRKGIAVPEKWREGYSEKDKILVKTLVGWLNKQGHPGAWLARLASMPKGTLGPLLNGSFGPSSPTQKLESLLAAVQSWESRVTTDTGQFVTTTVYRLCTTICESARNRSDFGVLSGYVGVGKTVSVKRYRDANRSNTVLVEADPSMIPKNMFIEMMRELDIKLPDAPGYNNVNAMYRLVLEKLAGTTYLVILDEAEKTSAKCLEYLRRLSDKAGIGIVLSGTEDLNYLIDKEHGHFSQIRSRVSVWNPIIKGLDEADIALLAQAALKEHSLDAPLLQRLWFYSQGSARMLAKNLIPNIKDYGLNKGHALTVDLVDQVATKVMSLPEYKQ
jgi:DNA transposition AAA+ family ATPase